MKGYLSAILSLCLFTSLVQADQDRDTLFQLSTIDALLAGVYQPLAQLDSLTEHGDFGLGTFAGLDGELILLDGVVYQAASDGQIHEMSGKTPTPFVSMTWFEADQRLNAVPGQNYERFQSWLAEQLPTPNLMVAVRVDGQFSSIRYRSVPKQTPPYRPLKEVAKEQTFFTRNDIRGTLVGFWCPSYVKGLNVPGFHLHFLSDDHRSGGHLLDFSLAEGEVMLDITNDWTLQMPTAEAFLSADLGANRTQALHAVEKDTSATR